jgi:hypothetical protein
MDHITTTKISEYNCYQGKPSSNRTNIPHTVLHVCHFCDLFEDEQLLEWLLIEDEREQKTRKRINDDERLQHAFNLRYIELNKMMI